MDTMTLSEISQILKISEHTARNRLSLGLPMPPSFRIGRRRLFIREEVYKWVATQAGQSFDPSCASPTTECNGEQNEPTNLKG